MIEEKTKQELLALLPTGIEQDASFRQLLVKLLKDDFADRRETESRFDRLLEELHRDREEQNRKWEESRREFDKVHEEIMAWAKRFERGIGALGAR